jgi:hypothetical protein
VLADHAEALQTLLTMTAGYSGTPLARKLGVKAESRVLVRERGLTEGIVDIKVCAIDDTCRSRLRPKAERSLRPARSLRASVVG